MRRGAEERRSGEGAQEVGQVVEGVRMEREGVGGKDEVLAAESEEEE